MPGFLWIVVCIVVALIAARLSYKLGYSDGDNSGWCKGHNQANEHAEIRWERNLVRWGHAEYVVSDPVTGETEWRLKPMKEAEDAK